MIMIITSAMITAQQHHEFASGWTEDQLKCEVSLLDAMVALQQYTQETPTLCSQETAKCPDGIQGTIDLAYTDCGGLTAPPVNTGPFDTVEGPQLKAAAELCKCSNATVAAPAFTLAAVVMTFFA